MKPVSIEKCGLNVNNTLFQLSELQIPSGKIHYLSKFEVNMKGVFPNITSYTKSDQLSLWIGQDSVGISHYDFGICNVFDCPIKKGEFDVSFEHRLTNILMNMPGKYQAWVSLERSMVLFCYSFEFEVSKVL